MQSGELQILKLAKSGTMVKPGDVVVEFDPTTLQRTIQEKQSELKQADAEIEQAQAQTRMAKRAERDGVDEGRIRHRARQARRQQGGHGVAASRTRQAKLAVVDAQQRQRELQAKIKSDQTVGGADVDREAPQAREGAVRPAARRAGTAAICS